MASTHAPNVLFDDFALLTQQFGRKQLIATSVNTDCDCGGSPSLNAKHDSIGYTSKPNHDDRYTDQIAQPAVTAH